MDSSSFQRSWTLQISNFSSVRAQNDLQDSEKLLSYLFINSPMSEWHVFEFLACKLPLGRDALVGEDGYTALGVPHKLCEPASSL